MQQTNSNQTIKKSNYTALIVISVFAVLLLCWRLMTLSGGGDNNKNDRSSMAVVQCENYVRDSLKSPSTAKFPMITTAKNLGNDLFTVSSYVDAQNSFGAVIRNNYYCKIQYTRGNDADQSNWNLIQLTLSE